MSNSKEPKWLKRLRNSGMVYRTPLRDVSKCLAALDRAIGMLEHQRGCTSFRCKECGAVSTHRDRCPNEGAEMKTKHFMSCSCDLYERRRKILFGKNR